MPCSARCCVLLLFLLAGPAYAQAGNIPPAAREPDFRVPAEDPRPPDGLLAATSIGERLRFGVGRFGVAERPRLRSHIEPVPRPTDVRRRHRGTAAIGFNLSF